MRIGIWAFPFPQMLWFTDVMVGRAKLYQDSWSLGESTRQPTFVRNVAHFHFHVSDPSPTLSFLKGMHH